MGFEVGQAVWWVETVWQFNDILPELLQGTYVDDEPYHDCFTGDTVECDGTLITIWRHQKELYGSEEEGKKALQIAIKEKIEGLEEAAEKLRAASKGA